jgi:BirA family transcriptional regulator, biotin operon repressor / biotin---[acetyl-CoA-carboxylase] ligase
VSSSIDNVFAELLGQGWLKQAEHFAAVDSTNSAARRFALDCTERLPALFVADQQTRGRGRGGNVWWSPRGCLMMTIAITDKMLPDQRELWGQLALLTGVSAAEAIERVCPELDIQLKWPNDLYLAGRKLGGILIESFTVGSAQVNTDSQISVNESRGSLHGEIHDEPTSQSQTDDQDDRRSIRPQTVFAIGIGVNVAMNWQTAPAEVAGRATCLASSVGKPVSNEELLYELIMSLANRVENWRIDRDSWFDVWHSRCLLSGKIVTINCSTAGLEPKQRLVGRCEGVANDGRLLVRTESGGVVPVTVGEVLNWQS